jgi:hypothetical protein
MPSAKNATRTHSIELKVANAQTTKSFRKRYGRFVQINRKQYELVFCEFIRYEGQEVAGLCKTDEKTIFIDISHNPIEETLIHEIVHAEVEESGLRQMVNWSDDLEELLAEMLAKSISHSYTLRLKK